MTHARVTVLFQPAGGTAADAVPASSQQVFIDLTPGTMTAARTNASGLLVNGTGAGTPVPLDDTRTYSVAVLPLGSPAPSTGSPSRVSGGRLTVAPHVSIRVTGAANLACTLTVGAAQSNVTTSRTGWIISNDRSAGVVTLASATRLLVPSGSSAPTVTLNAPAGSITRGSTARFTITLPAGIVGFHVTQWRYVLSHTNPNGTAQSATITRPATEAASTMDQFWEGEMCASGDLSIQFVSGVTLRTTGGAAVVATLTAMNPQAASLAVTVAARGWTTPLTQSPEGTFTRTIATFHDTGHHNWAPSASFSLVDRTVAAGPNRGCRFVNAVTGLSFTSTPEINADIVNLSSAFQSAQGHARVMAPASVRGQIVPTQFYTTDPAGQITIANPQGLLSHLGLASATGFQFLRTECISAADLLRGTRQHEHTGTLSHKQNCLRALRALDPMEFIEGFIDAPGGATVAFGTLLSARVTKVTNAAPTHNVVDEAATRSAGDLRFVAGQQLPSVNVDSAGNSRPVWNPAANAQLTN